MNYRKQRDLAIKIFGEILADDEKEVLKNGCFPAILSMLKNKRADVLKIIENKEIPSEWAYWWALYIGDHEVMRDRVKEPKFAYWYALNIGDREVMRDRVTAQEWAYEWLRNIGDREVMWDRVIRPGAYQWMLDKDDKEAMRDSVINLAYQWEDNIADCNLISDILTDSDWAYRWEQYSGGK